jgi:hypothetical protein
MAFGLSSRLVRLGDNMARKAELQAELDALGIEWKTADTIAVLEAKLEGGPEPVAEGRAPDPEEGARVEQKFVTIQAPPSWRHNVWNTPFLPHALRFNRDARAQLLVEQGGEAVTFDFMGASGMEQIPVADKVTEHPDLEVV